MLYPRPDNVHGNGEVLNPCFGFFLTVPNNQYRWLGRGTFAGRSVKNRNSQVNDGLSSWASCHHPMDGTSGTTFYIKASAVIDDLDAPQ